jgi:prevent-host-death family protein
MPEPRVVTATEARRSFHALVRAAAAGEQIVIEQRGKPRGVLISAAELEDFKRMKAEARGELAPNPGDD